MLQSFKRKHKKETEFTRLAITEGGEEGEGEREERRERGRGRRGGEGGEEGERERKERGKDGKVLLWRQSQPRCALSFKLNEPQSVDFSVMGVS